MGKPKKDKQKTKAGLSSPKGRKIDKPRSHPRILEAKDEPEPSENGKKEKILEEGRKTSTSGGFAGMIFMCNTQSKPECYRYRVFGLPKNKEQVVMNIKRGAKLFLYDFDSKVLYGVYKACSDGGMNLEPDAFGGRYPAQVMFALQRECLPVPESTFRHAIKENYYSNSKFNPELNAQQVESLNMLFQSIEQKKHLLAAAPAPAPALHVRGPIVPPYPGRTALHYHVENERVAAAVVLPPVNRQYPVSEVLPPTSRQYPVTNRQQLHGPLPPAPFSSRYDIEASSGGHQMPAPEGDRYRTIVQDLRYPGPIRALELVPHGRGYHVIPPERERDLYRPTVQDPRHSAPVPAPELSPHGMEYPFPAPDLHRSFVMQDPRYSAPLPASELAIHDHVLRDREYHVIPPERGLAPHLAHNDHLYVSERRVEAHLPVVYEQSRYHGAAYSEVGGQQPVTYNVHAAAEAPRGDAARVYTAGEALYGEAARVYSADPRHEIASAPVSSRYAFAGSLPITR